MVEKFPLKSNEVRLNLNNLNASSSVLPYLLPFVANKLYSCLEFFLQIL